MDQPLKSRTLGTVLSSTSISNLHACASQGVQLRLPAEPESQGE